MVNVACDVVIRKGSGGVTHLLRLSRNWFPVRRLETLVAAEK